MTFWTAIVVIVAICVIAEIVKSKHRAQAGILHDSSTGRESSIPRIDSALQHEVEELRERVKVLERIATEDRETQRLSAEIERLREK
ncbi:MAG: hypothetical protein ABIT09_10920 [Croceibacterium sp.]